ncbi:D-ribose pyranase [Texcoconibacillus texcoconensis]|uniref:D-ribose pyranase n=1 Tax=Texcoconibacillus texcoconensis TaxID=1095777 RepID=A0A840QM01_9BACI|nr:D-ribose pyranase [Texcoconibacillus texcoconensis]MBB5172394.1 D-ribose pyranase [Texcoconibacillus texcoconensis]
MQKRGILNRDIASILAKLGHTDQIAIADCGLPIPDHVLCIDLSLEQGTPSFIDVFHTLLDEMEVEQLYLAEEMLTHNNSTYLEMTKQNIPIEKISHDLLKEKTKQVKAIIRTGENTPFANIILQAGVIF